VEFTDPRFGPRVRRHYRFDGWRGLEGDDRGGSRAIRPTLPRDLFKPVRPTARHVPSE
jgi:hypothetical protein